jgi:ferredoxin
MIDHRPLRLAHLPNLEHRRRGYQTDAWYSNGAYHLFDLICPGRIKGLLISSMAICTELSTETAITYSKLLWSGFKLRLSNITREANIRDVRRSQVVNLKPYVCDGRCNREACRCQLKKTKTPLQPKDPILVNPTPTKNHTGFLSIEHSVTRKGCVYSLKHFDAKGDSKYVFVSYPPESNKWKSFRENRTMPESFTIWKRNGR